MAAYVGGGFPAESQFGMLRGRVDSVAPLPVTDVRILNTMAGSRSLAEYFMGKGPVLEVSVSLLPDAQSPSGYDWTLGTAPTRS